MKQLLRELFQNAAAVLRQRFRLWLALVLVAAASSAVLFPKDDDWLRWWRARRTARNQQIGNAISCWGDFPRGWLILLTTLGGAGLLTRRRHWQVAALAALIAAAVAGLEAHVVRYTVGRARPSSGLPDGFYGPSLKRMYHSLPSGHTTCAFAAATALAVLLPPLGAPCLLAAALVGWSRLALTAHYPTDVWVAMWFGILNGLLFGLAARRLLLKAADRPVT